MTTAAKRRITQQQATEMFAHYRDMLEGGMGSHMIDARADDDGPQLAVDDKGRIEAYVDLFGPFNQHNERTIRGAYAEAIVERFDTPAVSEIKASYFHIQRGGTPLGLPSEVEEREQGLWTITDVVDPDGIGLVPITMIREGVVDGASIDFIRAKSVMRYLEVAEYDETTLGMPLTWWNDPVEYSKRHWVGYAFTPYPSMNKARVEQARSILSDMSRFMLVVPELPEERSAPGPTPEPSPQPTEDEQLATGLDSLLDDLTAERERDAAYNDFLLSLRS